MFEGLGRRLGRDENDIRRQLARLVDPSSPPNSDATSAGGQAGLPLVRLAAKHRVTSNLIFHYPDVESLRAVYLADRGHEVKQRQADQQVLIALGEELEVVVLKGSVSKELLNPTLARRSSDLDLLVRIGSADRAGEILMSMGYAPDTTHQSRDQYRQLHHHDAPYVKDGGIRHTVEVHRHPLRNPVGRAVRADRFWDGAVDISLGDLVVRRLGDVDFAMNLAVHCFADEPTELRSVAETAAAFSRLSHDQQRELIAAAESPVLARAMLWSWVLVESTFPGTISPAVLDEVASRAELSRPYRMMSERIIGRFGTDLGAWYGWVAGMKVFLAANGALRASGLALAEIFVVVKRARSEARS